MKQIPFYLCLLCCLASSLKSSAQSVQELQDSFDALKATGDIKAALPFAEKMIRLLEQQAVMDTNLYIKKLLQLSTAYSDAYLTKEAEASSLKALAIAPQNDTLYANILIRWSATVGVQGEYERADSIAQLAVDLRRKLLGEDNIPFCAALLQAGWCQFQGGHISMAINTLEKSLSLWRKNNLNRPYLLVEILNNLGSCYYTLGKSSKAESCYKESLEIRASVSSLDQIPFADKLAFVEKLNLAAIFIDKGQYAEADQLIAEVQANMLAAGVWEDVGYSDIFTIKARLLSVINKNEEAIATAKIGRSMVIKAFGTNNPYLFQYDNLIGMDLIRLGKPDAAAVVYRAALDSMEVLGGKDWVEYVGMKTALPICYTNQHDYDTAIQLYLESLVNYENSGDDLTLKMIYFGLVENYIYIKNYIAGKKYLQKLQEIDISDNFIDRGTSILQATLSFFEKDYEGAAFEVRNYANNLKKQIGGEIFLFDDQKRQSQAQDLQSATNQLCTLLRADPAKNIPKLPEIALDFQLFTKSLLLTATQKIRTDILSGKDESLKQRYTDWINQKEELGYYYTRSKAELSEENIEISKLEAHADSLEKAIARASAAYNNVTNDLNINWQSIHKALKPGQAALEIVRYEGQFNTVSDSAHYAIFVITPERTEPAIVFIEDGDGLEQVLVEKHLLACTSASSTAPGSDLYMAVWSKVEPYLKNVKTIFISADGCFHKINFATLRQPDGTYLTDRYTFRPVFSLKDILNTKENDINEKTAFLLGNPTFSTQNDNEPSIASRTRTVTKTEADTINYNIYNPLGTLRDLDAIRSIDLKPLPGSQKEVDDLALLLQKNGWQTTLRTGTDAREEAIKAIRSPAILHLATHGYFLANERSGIAGLSRETVVRNPLLRSMLFFAGSQNTLDKKPLDSREDGILTAYEVQNMNLDATQLVVLSACKTGQGKVQNGEGVYGLQRALRIAGAQSLLISLWDVDDEVGRTFMQTFYEQWLGGKSKTEAFQATQLAIKAKYPHPFYWGGFILIGS